MMKPKCLYAIRLICIFLFFTVGCGLPADVKEEAERKTEQIAAARKVVDKHKAKYVKFITTFLCRLRSAGTLGESF